MEELLYVLESGYTAVTTVVNLREIDTTGYLEGTIPVHVTGVGTYQWDPASVVADNGTTVIKPTAVTGAGRWVRPQPGALGAATPGTRLFALADHSHAPTALALAAGDALYWNGTAIDGTPGVAAGELLVYNPATPAWERIGASTVGADLQGKPIANFHHFLGDAGTIAVGGGSVALNLNGATASLADTAFAADTIRVVGFAVTWWSNIAPVTKSWTDDLVVTVYRSAANGIILSNDAGATAAGAGAASLALTGGSAATYTVNVDTGTGLMTLSMTQDGVEARRALVTTYYRDAVPVSII